MRWHGSRRIRGASIPRTARTGLDWSPEPSKGYRVLFGEGVAPWKKIFTAAEKTGGLEYYLIE
jgi:hypothetical protein